LRRALGACLLGVLMGGIGIPAATIFSVQPVNSAQVGSNTVRSSLDLAESAEFTLSQSYVNVTITAEIGCCTNGVGEAFLTTSEGPGTTVSSEIASGSFAGTSAIGNVAVLTIPHLSAGTYYLILTSTSGLIGWEQATVSYTTSGDSGNVLVGNWYSPSSSGSYVPGYTYAPQGTPNQSHIFSLDATPVPEPTSVALGLVGVAAIAFSRLRKRFTV
jgi:hypothetical protein